MAGKAGRSGRKRHGAELKVNFNTKIDPKLRNELQAAADAANWSLSREIEMRLKNSLVPAGKVDQGTRALCLLIMEAARQTTEENRNWLNDSSTGSAFLRVLELLITMVRHSPRLRRARSIQKEFDRPAFNTAKEKARAVLFRIAGDLIDPRTEPYVQAARILGKPTSWRDHMQVSWQVEAEVEQALKDDPKRYCDLNDERKLWREIDERVRNRLREEKRAIHKSKRGDT